jgi:hypothetical protein
MYAVLITTNVEYAGKPVAVHTAVVEFFTLAAAKEAVNRVNTNTASLKALVGSSQYALLLNETGDMQP